MGWTSAAPPNTEPGLSSPFDEIRPVCSTHIHAREFAIIDTKHAPAPRGHRPYLQAYEINALRRSSPPASFR